MIKNSFFRKLYVWYRERYFWHLKKKRVEDIFSDIYKNNTWGGTPGTFYSGDGTYNPNASIYIEKIAAFIRDHDIKSILDIGCGDFIVMSKVLEKVNVNYTGADVVAELIEHHQKNFSSGNIRFITLNAIDDDLPTADLVTIRQVLQHLSNDQIKKILKKLSKFKYVIISEHMLVGDSIAPNIDKIPGPHIRTRIHSHVDLEAPPFDVKNAEILFEYREDEKIKSLMYPAAIRTYLVTNF